MAGKRVGLYLAGAVLLALLAGCAVQRQAEPEEAPDREKVTVAFWSDQLTEQYGQYLQKTFPDVEFEFYVATNSTDFYRFKNERGELPDILTVRRFALRDVADWKDALMDLSDTPLANTFHQSYLRSYTYSDGTVNWLPACAEVDGIIVNTALLEEHQIPLPTNYAEFVDTCHALTELGIQPFRSNFGADYTCMEILQGLSIQQLTAQTGREWRQRYESGQTDQLNEEVWLPVFERMDEFIRCAGLSAADLEGNTADMFDALKAGETAMIRGTSSEASHHGVDAACVMLPYFGETENWYLTYPSFQAAASVRAEQDPARKALILSILEAMLNQEGLYHISNGQDMIAYHKDAERKLSPMLAPMAPCLNKNLMYIRLASADMFSASQTTLNGMLTGQYPDARSAFDAFNGFISAEKMDCSGPAASIERDYRYTFDPQTGSEAASAVMNSLREELGAQLLVGQSVYVAGNIAAGDYTEAELRFLMMGESIDIMRCQITGDQLYRYLSSILSVRDQPNCVINDSALYVSSGFAMELKRSEGGYALERLTVDGKELDRGETYDLAILGRELTLHGAALKSVGAADYTKEETPYQQLIVDRLREGGQLAAPADYISVH